MLIENDTSEPVDYDIDVAGGGNGMMVDPTSGTFVVGKPRFSIAKNGGLLDFQLSDDGTGVSCRHIFLINDTIAGTPATTVVEMQDAPAEMNHVSLKSTEVNGQTFYRIELTKT